MGGVAVSQAERSSARPPRAIANPEWLRGVQRYQNATPPPTEAAHPVIWRHQQARCLYVAPENPAPEKPAPVVLLIPSLINRYYILDLEARLSLVRHLAQKGMHIYVLDWGTPQHSQAHEGEETYIQSYLEPLQRCLSARHGGQRVCIIGYCLGGLLALALAIRQPELTAGLGLLATPWDFQASGQGPCLWGLWHAAFAEHWCRHMPLLPGEYMAWLFYLADPEHCLEKYARFARLPPHSAAYQRFVAVEHWVHDTVPLTRAFARTCLIAWAQLNGPARLQWRVQGQVIDPQQLRCPALVVAPTRDRIVPRASAMAITQRLSSFETLTPETGHIGMVIGRRRHEALWEPLAQWLHKTGGQATSP